MRGSETVAETVVMARRRGGPRLRLRFVALVAAVAVALGLLAGVRPARAGDDDLAKALAALAIVGIIVAQNNKAHAKPPVFDEPPRYRPVAVPRVPGVCAIEIEGRNGRASVFPESCLRREGFDWRLPRDCARQARIYGREDRVYSDQCLRDAGFRIGGHRN